MAFSQDTLRQAGQRSGGHCECTNPMCGHSGYCDVKVPASPYCARHITPVADGGDDSLGNCEILCSTCYQNSGEAPGQP